MPQIEQLSQLAPSDHLSIQRADSRGWSYYLFRVTTQMVSQTARLMGIHVLLTAGKEIMTPQLRWCNVHQLLWPIRADEIALFRCPTPAPLGASLKMCFVFAHL